MILHAVRNLGPFQPSVVEPSVVEPGVVASGPVEPGKLGREIPWAADAGACARGLAARQSAGLRSAVRCGLWVAA